MEGIVIDTNVFVAAGLNPRSASARVLAAVRQGRFQLISVDPDAFVLVRDRDDRKFAALSAAAKRPLVTNENHLLADRNIIGIDALTPRAILAREGEDT